jgi:hypothetical protein
MLDSFANRNAKPSEARVAFRRESDVLGKIRVWD